MSARRKVRVFVASDVRLYRECLSRLIATEDALKLAGAARTAESPSRLRAGAHPDVIIVDAIQILDLTLAREIASAAGEARVVALVAPDLEDDLLGLAGAGVSGFLSWEASSRQLVEIVERAARGERPCSPDVADAILRRAAERSGGDLSFDGSLTKREAQTWLPTDCQTRQSPPTYRSSSPPSRITSTGCSRNSRFIAVARRLQS